MACVILGERCSMKRMVVLLILTLFGSDLFADTAAPTVSDFLYNSDIAGEIKAEALYQVHLSDAILQKAGKDLQDIRIYDASRKETPYVIIGNVPPHKTIETYPLEIIGYDSDASSATVIMRLPEKHSAVSVLDLDIANQDYKKRVSLDASFDGKTWKTITEDSIYDFSSRVDVRRTSMEFPETEARFLRLTLRDYESQKPSQPSMKLTYDGLDFSVNGERKTDLRIRAAHASTGKPEEKKPVYDQRNFPSPATTLDKDGNTVIVLPAELPLDKLTLEVANPYFHRTVYVYSSNTGKEDSYSILTSQAVYRFPLSSERREEKSSIEQHVSKQSFYKIVIMNRNNPPLEIKGITLSWVQQNLYFVALKSNDRYTLCYGNARIKKPDYDLVSFVNKDTLFQHPYERRDLAPVQIGSGPQPTLGERIAGIEKPILTIIVVLLVVGMGCWLYVLMRQKPKQK
jgi:hypothetical protein